MIKKPRNNEFKARKPHILNVKKPHMFIKNIKFMTPALSSPGDMNAGHRFYVKKQNFLS